MGWSRAAWEDLTGRTGLGPDLPADAARAAARCRSTRTWPTSWPSASAAPSLRARRVELAELEDEVEALFDRGWTDGLPVVPPDRGPRPADAGGHHPGAGRGRRRRPARPRSTSRSRRSPSTRSWPAAGPSTCPWVLAAVEAVCNDEFNMHGVLATTMPVGPVIIANGPGTVAIGMNSGGNVLGQGNRANLTIGRALQLVIRNVGGGRPGGVDRATHGNPGKLSFCFAEDEVGSPWTLAGRVAAACRPARTRSPCSPARARGASSTRRPATPTPWPRPSPSALGPCTTPSCVYGFDAVLVVGPEHARVFADAGWDRERVVREINARTAAARRRARARRRRHGRGRARPPSPTPRCPSSATAASCSSTPEGGPACSLPSSGAGPTGRSAASRSPGRCRDAVTHDRDRSSDAR